MLRFFAPYLTWQRLAVFLLLGLILFPLFFDLHRAPIQPWDEARQAVNAYEMYAHGQWLVTTFDLQPDLWNTKPPLLIWLQALCIAGLGPTELAIRLPSALAALGTVLLLYGFCARHLRNPGAGLALGFILVTAQGYVNPHVTRTGDYDALLTWWLVLGLVTFFLYLETNRPRYLLLWGVSVAAAVLTKGVAGLLGSPALLLYVLSQRKLLLLVRRPAVWLALLGSLALPVAYYLAREATLPGYLQAVWNNELGGRYAAVIENHDHPWYFYAYYLYDYGFTPWFYLLLPALLILAVAPPSAAKRFAVLLVLFAGCWAAVISSSQTKLEWYVAPLYPIMACLIGLAFSFAYRWLTDRLPGAYAAWYPLLGTIVLLLLVAQPYQAIIEEIISQRTSDVSWGNDADYGTFLRRYTKRQPDVHQLTFVSQGGYQGPLVFYREAYDWKGIHLTCLPPDQSQNFTPGSEIIVCDPALREQLTNRYETNLVYEEEQCAAFQIVKIK